MKASFNLAAINNEVFHFTQCYYINNADHVLYLFYFLTCFPLHAKLNSGPNSELKCVNKDLTLKTLLNFSCIQPL